MGEPVKTGLLVSGIIADVESYESKKQPGKVYETLYVLPTGSALCLEIKPAVIGKYKANQTFQAYCRIKRGFNKGETQIEEAA